MANLSCHRTVNMVDHAVEHLHDTIFFWILVGCFAAFGAIAQLLSEGWLAQDTSKNVGKVMIAMFASWVVGLVLEDRLGRERTGLIVAIAAFAGWHGRAILSNSAILDHFWPSKLPPKREMPNGDS